MRFGLCSIGMGSFSIVTAFPVEITQAANLFVRPGAEPAKPGTHANQIAAAMRTVGLEPFHINASNDYVSKSTLYGYLRGHVPILPGRTFRKGCAAFVSMENTLLP